MKDMRNNPIENGNLCFRSRIVNGETLMGYALVISNKLFWKDGWNNYISSHDKLNSKQLIVIEHLNICSQSCLQKQDLIYQINLLI